MTTFDEASDLIAANLSRTRKYPEELKGFSGLVNGLIKAESITNVEASRIVAKCAEISQWCPTDADLLNVARDLARVDAVAAGTFDSTAGAGNSAAEEDRKEWERQYGRPAPFEWHKLDLAHVKAVKDRESVLLAAIRQKYPGELNWHQMSAAARALGYEDYARAWERAVGA